MSGRFALIIGNQEYQDSGLNTGLRAPKSDVEALSQVLSNETIGAFTVQTVLDKTFGEVRDAIVEFLSNKQRAIR